MRKERQPLACHEIALGLRAVLGLRPVLAGEHICSHSVVDKGYKLFCTKVQAKPSLMELAVICMAVGRSLHDLALKLPIPMLGAGS